MLTQKEIDELSVNKHSGTLKSRYVLGKKKELANNQTYDQICQTNKSRNASGIKRRRKHVIGKQLRPSIKKKQLMIINKRKISDDRLSVPGIMEPKAAPLSYVGRELLMEDERICLDAFCGQPMHKDDVVFFNWNITIGRQSMVDYLQGGGTQAKPRLASPVIGGRRRRPAVAVGSLTCEFIVKLMSPACESVTAVFQVA
ncbi:hypothetical protein AXF42_Ash016873 [Apostasia shenzhenica]|uniref:Uncharacterized protein n=1 Tax=Apostasia shenzhenica TaxID=1088818 RepID=A0A2H9ZRD5_9ASPA|nr:hypothetical protein AXF42_Ash016873 [Apostasia shenzhenica]